MLDPAILLSLEAPMPPQPPSMAQEQLWLSPQGTAAQRLSQKLTDTFNERADEWIGELNAIRDRAQSQSVEGRESPEVLAVLDRLVEDYEAHADIRAKISGRLVKRIDRDVKALFKVDPSLGAVARTTGDKIVATDKRIVECLLEFALFIRALRAEASGEAQGGTTFDDPDALRRYLENLAA